MHKNLRWFAARAYPYMVVAPFLMTAWLPPSLNAGWVTACGLVLGGLLCIAGVAQGPRPLARAVGTAVGMTLATAAWFVCASLWASNPWVSLFAPFGAGAWVLTAVWLCAGVALADGRMLRETVAAISAAGAFFAAAAVYEAISQGATRTQGYAAGFFENSTSAGEIFALTIVTAVIGALIARNLPGRVAFAAAGALSAIGLALSSSRTAVLGLVLAGVFALLVVKLPGGQRNTRILTLVPPIAALVLTVVAVVSSYGGLGPVAADLVSRVGTERDAIWRSAWAQFSQSPVIGKGLAQFSALIQWSGLSTGGLQYNATADPHNTLLAAAVGGGVIGLTLMLVALGAVLNTLVARAREGRTTWPVALVTATPVLILGMGMVGWVSAATVLASSALIGVALGSGASGTTEHPRKRAVGIGVVRTVGIGLGVLAVAFGVAYARPLSVEYRFVHTTGPLSSAEAESLYRRFPLPGLGEQALAALAPEIASGSAAARERAVALIALTERDAARDSTLALRSMVTAQALSGGNSSGFALFERQMNAGHEADPASGLWYAFAASEAGRLGLPQQAAAYAQKALDYPQDEPTRAWLMTIR